MYQILIKNVTKDNSWRIYGTKELVGNSVVYTEFETNDKDVLGEEIYKLTKQYGTDNLRIISNIPFTVKVIATESAKDKYEFFLVESE